MNTVSPVFSPSVSARDGSGTVPHPPECNNVLCFSLPPLHSLLCHAEDLPRVRRCVSSEFWLAHLLCAEIHETKRLY